MRYNERARQMWPCGGELYLKTEKVSIAVSDAERQRFLKAAGLLGLDESGAARIAVKEFTQKHLKAR